MAANNEYNLGHLHPNQKTDWNIKVRVSRMWREINQQNAEIRGLNLILVDQSVSASLLSDHVKKQY